MNFFSNGLVVFFGLFVSSIIFAQELAKPTGSVILTIEGDIKYTNTLERTAEFDRQMLMNLGMVSLTTGTPWSETVDKYEGPLLRSLTDAVGVKSGTLSVKALNDYAAYVPVQDGHDYDVVLAMKINGRDMRIREKGPIFILYPFDSNSDLNNEVIHNRSVWQIKSINVE